MKSYKTGRNQRCQYHSKAALAFLLMNACSATNLRSFNKESLMQQEIISLNNFNENRFRHATFARLNDHQPHELVQIGQDDLDDTDIAAFSMDMSTKADDFKTLGEQKIEKQEEEQKKKEEAKKAAAEKARLAKKKKEDELKKKKAEEAAKKRKAEMEKKEKEERDKRDKEINEQLKMEAKQIPDDPQVMKAYSLAIAQSAESNEPESPVVYEMEQKSEANGDATDSPSEQTYDV